MSSFLTSLLGSGVEAAGTGIGAVLGGVGTLAKDIRTAITGDLSIEKKAEIELKLTELDNAIILAQSEINKVEAASGSKFVSWWRPAVGWVCVFGMGYKFIFRDLINWGSSIYFPKTSFPVLDTSEMIPLLIALLGLGSLRTYEKTRGVNNS